MNREDLGWNSFFQNQLNAHPDESLIPARVIYSGRGIYRLAAEKGEWWAEAAGSIRYKSLSAEDLPVCGDWVLADAPAEGDRTVIRRMLARQTQFTRQQAGTKPGAQVVSANVDTVCIVSGLDADFNLRRIERYLAIAWESGARPVIVLNKADVCDSIPARLEEAEKLSTGVPVFVLSAETGDGMEQLFSYMERGRTLALLGSSGVGKSSIVNRLLGGAVQAVREIDSETGRGVHTTTARYLFLLPSGGLIMDTPGMRELQAWSAESGLDAVFNDIQSLAKGCRYRDCSHQCEPGCQVIAAIARGELASERLESFQKLSKEARYIELKNNHSASWVERERWKKVAKQVRRLPPQYR